MDVIYQFEEPQLRDLHALHEKEWWSSNRTFEETKTGVKRSQVNIGLVDNQARLVAYARVLTDYVFKALIFDVIVAREARGGGRGDRLITLVLEHPELRKVKHFELYCRPEMFPFYKRHGFSDYVGETRLMRLDTR